MALEDSKRLFHMPDAVEHLCCITEAAEPNYKSQHVFGGGGVEGYSISLTRKSLSSRACPSLSLKPASSSIAERNESSE